MMITDRIIFDKPVPVDADDELEYELSPNGEIIFVILHGERIPFTRVAVVPSDDVIG